MTTQIKALWAAILIRGTLITGMATVMLMPADAPTPEAPMMEQKIWNREHILPDGRAITCLQVHDTGFDCNWAGVSDDQLN